MTLKPAVTAVAGFSLFALSCASWPSYASTSGLSVGRGFICNTEAELQAAVTRDDTKISASLASVNNRFGQDACTFATALFEKAGDGRDMMTGEGMVRVEKVKLVGYLVGNEFQQIAEPKDQFFGVSEDGAGA
jgi:hypothetical protein